jgi:tripartite ATP-independent transporter DctP family solute receptor
MKATRQASGSGRRGWTALAAGLTLASVSAVSAVSAQEVTLRASGHFPAGHTASIGMEIMNSELGRLTNGEVAIDYFPGSQLGGAFEGVDQVRTGQIDIDLGGPEWFGRVVPEVDVVNLPFLASGDKNAYCIIDSGLSAHLNAMSEKAGLVILGWMSNGARHVTNNERPLKSVDDVAGLKLRTPPSEIYLETFRALGANPTPIDIKELYQALQQGVVDGQENPYGNIMVRKFDEVQKYLSNTGHFFSWGWVVMHKGSYDELSDAHKEALHEAAFRAVAAQRALAERENEAAVSVLMERGMQYDEIPAAELAKFRDAVRSVYDTARDKVGGETLDLAMSAVESCG